MAIAPPERWRQIEALFAEAVDLSAAERAEFLRLGNVDPDVRRDLERLLAAYDRSDGFLGELDRSRCADLLDGASDPEEGGTIGPYTMIRRLGRGGMGVVYLAQDSRLGRAVALKLLPRRLGTDDVAKRRFADEAKAASALDHPRIAPIYEMGETTNGRLYIAMAYCEGETLRDMIARGPLPVDTALGVGAQIADGLVAAHAAGIVHRDIKPGNVIVSPDGTARIVDFGVAKSAGDALTQPGATLGTVAYMSPEQTRGARVDPRTDLWSLGVTLFEMLAGVRPFRADDDQALIYAIRHDDAPRLRDLRPDVPLDAVRVVTRCLMKEPAARYQSARDLLADLVRVAHGLGAAHTKSGPLHRSRLGRPVALTAAALAGLIGGIGWWAWSRRATATSPSAVTSSIAVARFAPAGVGRDTVLERVGRELVITVSANLDGAAGLRAVEPITILAQPEANEPKTTLRDLGDFARRLGAARVIHGTLVRSGDEIRVDAGIFDAADLSPRGRISTRASMGDITGLTDSISLALLRELGAGVDTPIPSLASITTSSVEALREYLAGEQAMARAQFRLAPEHFARAIAADSSFWFAYWRYLYARSYHGERVDSAITATVLAHRHEFPEADRLLIESRLVDGQRARLGRRQDIVRLFPNYWP
ncbi:MAG TPA: serine/threonine-protein kinase, partial [Gemmatimonadaceae bacterium]|nr:serine/threonine-protein kinase [Gemmatimonadaceae bacterium]